MIKKISSIIEDWENLKNSQLTDDITSGEILLLKRFIHSITQCANNDEDKRRINGIFEDKENINYWLGELENLNDETVKGINDMFSLYEGSEFQFLDIVMMDRFKIDILFLRVLISSWGTKHYPKYDEIINSISEVKDLSLSQLYVESVRLYAKDRRQLINIIYDLSFFCMDIRITKK